MHAQIFFNRKCKHFYDKWFPLLQRWQFHRSCMSRCSSIGNVSTVHVYIYIWRWKRHARTAIWYMVPLFERGQFHISCMRICYEPLLNLGVTLYCTIIMYWADYWQFLLSCMSRCSFNWKCKHGSRIYIYDDEKGTRAHLYDIRFPLLEHGQFHLSSMHICLECKHRSRTYVSNGRDIKKGTQSSVLAWREAFLLGRLLLLY